jgi:uncharacterized membrane protein YraQ (UPF0718 family)
VVFNLSSFEGSSANREELVPCAELGGIIAGVDLTCPPELVLGAKPAAKVLPVFLGAGLPVFLALCVCVCTACLPVGESGRISI